MQTLDRSVTLATFPRGDAVFAAYVRGCWTGLSPTERTPESLQRVIRRWHARATVSVRSGLAGFGDRATTWYVYRDGRAGMTADDEWWTEPGVAVVTFDESGIFTSANEAADALAGRAVVGLRWQDLVPSDARDSDAAWVWEALRRDRVIDSEFDLPVDDDKRLVVEYRTTLSARHGEYESRWRVLTTVHSRDVV